VTTTDNTDVLVFHSRAKLTQHLWEAGQANCAVDEMCPVGQIILGIPGVTTCKIEPYGVAVVKAPLYDWDEIRPKIMNAILEWNRHLLFLDGKADIARDVVQNIPREPVQSPEPDRAEPPELTAEFLQKACQSWLDRNPDNKEVVQVQVIEPEPERERHVECACWSTGEFRPVAGCPYHPWAS
jgi:hypothetical protein